MNGPDLRREHLVALRATPFEAARRLHAAGVSWRTIATVAPAFTGIRVDGGRYEPDPDLPAAFVVPVRVDSAICPEAADPLVTVNSGEIVDLVAFHPAKPDRWALRVGAAEWLGAIEPQYLDPEPVPIWRCPLSWLQAGCAGLVMLSRSLTDHHRALSGCRSVVAEDSAHAAELRRVLGRPFPVPAVLVSRGREVRHAA